MKQLSFEQREMNRTWTDLLSGIKGPIWLLHNTICGFSFVISNIPNLGDRSLYGRGCCVEHLVLMMIQVSIVLSSLSRNTEDDYNEGRCYIEE